MDKHTSILLTEADQERLDRIREETGMCNSVNIRQAIFLMDHNIQVEKVIRRFCDGSLD